MGFAPPEVKEALFRINETRIQDLVEVYVPE
jgi:hypothetical protein